MLEWAEHLVDVAGVQDGERVLDLGCGTGFVARRAALRAGGNGLVEGVDVNPMMLAEARRATGLVIHDAAAESTGLRDGSFDVVLCQQGLQYFPDPRGTLAETRRILASGGRTAFSVWAGLDDNPFIAAQIGALESHLEPEVVASFRATNVGVLGGPDGMAALFDSAGFASIQVEKHELDIDLPPMDTYFPALIAATPWAGVYASLDASQQRERHRVRDRRARPDPRPSRVTSPHGRLRRYCVVTGLTQRITSSKCRSVACAAHTLTDGRRQPLRRRPAPDGSASSDSSALPTRRHAQWQHSSTRNGRSPERNSVRHIRSASRCVPRTVCDRYCFLPVAASPPRSTRISYTPRSRLRTEPSHHGGQVRRESPLMG